MDLGLLERDSWLILRVRITGHHAFQCWWVKEHSVSLQLWTTMILRYFGTENKRGLGMQLNRWKACLAGMKSWMWALALHSIDQTWWHMLKQQHSGGIKVIHQQKCLSQTELLSYGKENHNNQMKSQHVSAASLAQSSLPLEGQQLTPGRQQKPIYAPSASGSLFHRAARKWSAPNLWIRPSSDKATICRCWSPWATVYSESPCQGF